MDLSELAVFKAVVDHRGFARAAGAVFRTQSAVSQAVRRLEEELQAPLLTRSRPPEPTPAGVRLYRHAVDLLGRNAAARADIDDILKGGAGVLRLGASQALSRELLPGLVRSFHARRPMASLQIESHPSRELIGIVADGRLELGLGPLQKSMPGFGRCVLTRQRMVLYAGRGTGRALRREGEPALHRIPLVTSYLDPPGTRPGGGKLRDLFRTVWVVQSLDLRLSIIRDGLAVGYLPESVVDKSRAFVPMDWLDSGVIERQAGLFWIDKRKLTELAAELVSLAPADGSPRRGRS
jgi:LysR family transcriptional regulator, benzoate and cis,cis-muconate-responsive activator of ben and cat genes